MIAPSELPDSYRQWNRANGSPHGYPIRFERTKERMFPPNLLRRVKGPYSIQPNNTNRAFEYPWAFEAGKIKPGMRILEIGGGLAGFQFTLERHGCKVVNVDPGLEAAGVGWLCDHASMDKLNRIFQTNVDLRNTTIDRADLKDGEFDIVYSISVIEHLPPAEVVSAIEHAYRSLKRGGLFILTVDLFLNIEPFCTRQENEYGRNQNVKEMMSRQPWERLVGTPGELFGFPEFNTNQILCRLEKFLLGSYPALTQCLVMKKP